MQIQHKDISGKGMFFIEEENNTIAELVYSMRGSHKMVIEHTEVQEDLRGNSLGYDLVNESVDYARKHGLKIVPVCPFAKAVFDKELNFKDVLT